MRDAEQQLQAYCAQIDSGLTVPSLEEAMREQVGDGGVGPVRDRRSAHNWPAWATAVVAFGLVVAFGMVTWTVGMWRDEAALVVDQPTLTGSSSTGGFSCPPGSTPDQLGPGLPRPPQDGYAYGATTFDPGSGRVLRLTSIFRSEGAFWTFDVCTNTWASEPLPEAILGVVKEFVYDVDSGRFIAFVGSGRGVAQIWTYESDTQVWTEKNEWAAGGGGMPQLQAVYDPVSGLVVVREQVMTTMWTYDVDSDTWTDIDQGTTLPPPATESHPESGLDTFGQILTYDASVDRLILYDARRTDPAVRGSSFGPVGSIWEFDIRAGQWEEQDAVLSAPPGYGWGGAGGDGFIFDEANGVSVLFGGTLATYDATEHTWTVLQQGAILTSPHAEPPASHERLRNGFAMTYDSVNERILVFGGETLLVDGVWEPTDEVIAFDVATGEWITLLEPTAG